MTHGSGGRTLSLEWIETGGPRPQEPTKQGFGSTLLQRVLSVQCEARVELRFDELGLRFRMVAPLIEQRLVPAY